MTVRRWRNPLSERHQTVGVPDCLERRPHARDLGVRPHAVKPSRHGQLELAPALGADQQRPGDVELSEHSSSPADG